MLKHTNENSIWMGDPPNSSFSVHPSTYVAPNHSGDIWVDWIFLTHHVGTKGLALEREREVPTNLSTRIQGVHLSKKAIVFGHLSILVMHV